MLLLVEQKLFAQAGIVVNHSANRSYCTISDTAPDASGLGQQIADDIILNTPATIRHITWWGLYYFNAVPLTETIRIRFYNARPGDKSPGSILFEQNMLNPPRAVTGDQVSFVPPGTGGIAAEYKYESDLPLSFKMDAGILYWLEIAQVGIPDTIFAWRRAKIEQTGIAVINPNYGDWIHYDGFDDLAFQLSTIPEPSTSVMIIVGISLLRRSRRLAH